jgi:hypothetical protein
MNEAQRAEFNALMQKLGTLGDGQPEIEKALLDLEDFFIWIDLERGG